MKRALLLLSLLAVPCVLTSCKDDNTTAQSTDTAVPGTPTATVSTLDKLCRYWELEWVLEGYSEKEIKILRAGYEGDTTTLNNLKKRILLILFLHHLTNLTA